VAAIRRKSTEIGDVLPTRSIVFSCRTLNSLACREMGSSPISSRKRVPLFEISTLPFFNALAPVKAPFSWPNSSLSRSVSAKAEQFTAIRGSF